MTVAPPESDPPPSQWELLALAYADGELSEADRRAVEAHAASDSDYLELLNDLSQTGPANRELWSAENPSEGQWAEVKAVLLEGQKRNTPVKSGRFRWDVFLGFLAACFVFGLISVFAVINSIPWTPAGTGGLRANLVQENDLLAEYDVLPIATPEDVMISSVRGSGEVKFVSCKHPLPDSPNWAKFEDVKVISGPTVATMSNTTAGEMPIYNLDPADRDR